MSASAPNDLWLVRHGETTWSAQRRHTGRADLPLTERGERQAAALGRRLAETPFALVLASPLQRARRTAELAGFGDRLELDAGLMEVDYGQYEGRTTAEIQAERPGWELWRDGCPEGETIADAARRLAAPLARAQAADGPALIVAHAHLLRTLAAVALGLDPRAGRHLWLDPATVSVIGVERSTPVVRRWNDAAHLADVA